MEVEQTKSSRKSIPFVSLLVFDIREYTRNRWLLLYSSSYFLFSAMILHFGGGRPIQAYASLMNLVLLMIPLFTLLFGGISFLDSIPFLELVLSKKVSRLQVYLARWLALASGLSLACMAGIGLASVLFLSTGGGVSGLFALLALTIPLHFVFAALAFLIALVTTGREMMLGILLGLWFYLYIFYDLLILGAGYFFGDYPLEVPVFLLVLLNPLDLVRIVLLFQVELSSLIGFGGALFSSILGDVTGVFVALALLSLWTLFPFLAGLLIFKRKDF